MIRNSNDELAVKKGCYFDVDAALHVRDFFNMFLRHSKGKFAGQGFELLDWQWKRLVAPVFGWKTEFGKRRFKKVYNEIPKKNGKSTICAGVALYLLCGDDEEGAEVYSVAGDKEQASIVFNEASNMVLSSEELSERILVIESKKKLSYPDTKSIYRVLSSDASTKEGYNASGIILDEYHVQKNDDLRDALEFSGAAREQPLFFIITTAGEDKESPCYKEREYAVSVANGTIADIGYYPLIYSADDEKDDWQDEATWYKANPSLGTTISLESFKQDYENVIHKPRKLGKFKRYRLNIWTNEESKWLQLDDWDKCKSDKLLPKLGDTCYSTLDLATTQDINANVYYFPDTNCTLEFYWVPKNCVMKRCEDNKFRYDSFIHEGLITEVPGKVMDYNLMFDKVVEMGSLYNIKKIGCDPYNATHLCNDLIEEGFEVVFYRQNFANLSNASKFFERNVLQHTYRHHGNKVTRWMAKNVVTEEDKLENIRPCKKKSGEKIDGIVCIVMCYGLWLNDEHIGEPKITVIGNEDKDNERKLRITQY